jgi:PAS domain S-box-containing protein
MYEAHMNEKLRVLLVEDVAADAELTVTELERGGMACNALRVETAVDYRRALDEFKPVVILSDSSMPRFDGMQALAIARKSHPDIPFIFVSGTLGEEYAIRALKNGAADYVLKHNLIRLPSAVEKAIKETPRAHERRALETQLREGERRYRELFENHPHPMWVCDVKTGQFLAVNDMALKRYGFSRQEFLSMSVKDITAESGMHRLSGQKAKPVSTSDAPEIMRYRTKNGELIDVESSSHDFAFEGRPARVEMAYDITGRLHIDTSLRESERVKAAVIKGAPDCFVTTDHNGRIVEFNPAAEATFEYTLEQALGIAMTELLVSTQLRDVSSSSLGSNRFVAEGFVFGERMETPARRADGTEFPVEVSVTSCGSGTRQLFTYYIRDVTERKKREDMILRLARLCTALREIKSAIVRIREDL